MFTLVSSPFCHQMAYWGAHTANLPETVEPAIDFIQRLAGRSKMGNFYLIYPYASIYIYASSVVQNAHSSHHSLLVDPTTD
jgi:hypothetical protein